MRLADLTRGLEHTVLQGTEDKDVKALIYFSEEAVPGSMFFAIPGTEKNGLDFAADAVKRGADVVAVQQVWVPPQNLSACTVILAADVRKALAHVSSRFFCRPCESLLTAAVTGTKGKTTSAFMLQEIMECAGQKTGLLGTVYNGWKGNFEEAERTTPPSCDIQRWCRKMCDAGCCGLVMEVSSQAMKQSRVEGISFDLGIFTNLSPDHIGPGEHASFDEYAGWKAALFLQCEKLIINEDEPAWRQLLPEERRKDTWSFGTSSCADYCCRKMKRVSGIHGPGMEFELEGHQLELALPGNFNCMNAAAAAAAADQLGIRWDVIRDALARVQIPGRAERVMYGGPATILVDYAHNGTSLRQILTELRQYGPKRILLVFGCGGERDRNRRFEMGRTAAQLADLTIVTSDNPRREPPEMIINDITEAMDQAIAEGASGTYITVTDRGEAIVRAAAEGRDGDIILIAGKGHETYQLADGKKIYFDDRICAAGAGRSNIIMGECEL